LALKERVRPPSKEGARDLMLGELQKLKEKDRAFVLAAVKFSRDLPPEELLQGYGLGTAGEIRGALQEFQREAEGDRQGILDREWAHLRPESAESLLHHADPAWISESFQGENPAVLALILKDFPKAKVGGVLKDLPKDIRKQLKNFNVAKIPAPIRALILKHAEAQFPRVHLGAHLQDEVLKKMSDLNIRQMEELLRELGLTEMALAFSRVKGSALKAIFNRLKPEDAKEFRKRQKGSSEYNSAEHREAQLQILSLDFDKMGPEKIIQEIGLGVLSRAFEKGEQDLATFFTYKFNPRQGYLFKRLIEKNSADSTAKKVRRVRERILDALTRLKE